MNSEYNIFLCIRCGQNILKPDKEKLTLLADVIRDFEMPTVKSDEAQFVIAKTVESLSIVSNELRRSVKELA